ncbi:D/-alanyl-D/-alanine carboxypeptidase [Caudoviricetes sp.]|nr:D/-alanyl-D/-alanine carboxypeptidase [Caudoviricetes sp.]
MTLLRSSRVFADLGDPNTEKSMVSYDIETHLEHGAIPKKLYCNKLLVAPFRQALTHINQRGFANQVKTWDGCFNIRKKKGGSTHSLHAWGLAVDINAAWNGWLKTPTMSKELVQCFLDAGFEWGGYWQNKDGMHFQLSLETYLSELQKTHK